ncbi:MAG: cytochrome c [Pseudomonadota bacterium]
MRRTRTILMVAAVFSASLGGWFYWQSQERQATQSAEAGAAMVQVHRPELSKAALQGETLFRANCATCHGDIADGRVGRGPPLVHKIYEPSHHGDASFFLAAAQGVRAHHWPFGNMPPVDTVSQDEVGKIVVYVRSLQRANGIF